MTMSWEGKNNPNYKHGMRHTNIYKVWQNMKSRCLNPNVKGYSNYGGRGITICDKWINSFLSFYEDMGSPPTKNHMIERKNNNGNYWKKNCTWATRQEQNLNKRQQKFTNKYGYRGVDKSKSSYLARIGRKYIGCFGTPEEAALAYNKEARKLYGANAILNKVTKE